MPHSENLPTPSNPSATGTTYYGATVINAPADVVWKKFLSFSDYTWNSFTPAVTFSTNSVKVGDSAILDVRNLTSKPMSVPVEVTMIDEANHKLSWKGTGYPSWWIMAERVQQVVSLADGENGERRCEFISWETMQGAARMITNWMLGAKLDRLHQTVADDLKKVVEAEANQSA